MVPSFSFGYLVRSPRTVSDTMEVFEFPEFPTTNPTTNELTLYKQFRVVEC